MNFTLLGSNAKRKLLCLFVVCTLLMGLGISASAVSTNLALGKAVTATGMVADTDFYGVNPPSNIIDGNLNTKWAPIYKAGWPADGTQPIWTTIDLGASTPFNKIDLNYGDAVGRDPINYVFQSSNDGTNFTNISGTTVVNGTRSTTGALTKVFTFSTVTARYLRLNITKWAPYGMYINELAVYKENLKDISGFTLPQQSSPAVIDLINHTVTATVPYGMDVRTLTPTITLSEGATISPLTGVPQNFSTPVVYTVTASDGLTQSWTVTVNQATPTNLARGKTATGTNFSNPSDAIDGNIATPAYNPDSASASTLNINFGTGTTFNKIILVEGTGGFSGQSGIYDGYNRFVQTGAVFKSSTDGTNFSQIAGASITNSQHFGKKTLVYELATPVTSNYLQLSIPASPLSYANIWELEVYNIQSTGEINSFAVSGSGVVLHPLYSSNPYSTVVDTTNRRVDITVPYGSDVSALTPTIGVPSGCTILPASGVVQNFIKPVTYTVTNPSGVSQNWTVTVYTGTKINWANYALFYSANDFGINLQSTNITTPINAVNNEVTDAASITTGGIDSTIMVYYYQPGSPSTYVARSINQAVVYYGAAGVSTANPGAFYIESSPDNSTWTKIPGTDVNAPTSTGIQSTSLNFDTVNQKFYRLHLTKPSAAAKIVDFQLYNIASSAHDITAFTLPLTKYTTTIDAVAHTISIKVPIGTSRSTLIPTITLSSGASLYPLANIPQDFTKTLIYTVMAQDGTTQQWTVTTTEQSLASFGDFVVNSITFTDAAGNALANNTLNGGSSIKATAIIQKNNAANGSVSLVMAIYGPNGVLKKVKITPQVMDAVATGATVNVTASETFTYDTNGIYAKAFVWNGVSALKPLNLATQRFPTVTP